MQFTTNLTYVLIVFTAVLLSLVRAAPLIARDVYVPPITYPHPGTIWKIGSYHNVTWDTTNPPEHITNSVGRIVLRKGVLATDIVLKSGFNILDGRVVVQVPKVTPDKDYSLVLFGDSGNFSPQFTITH
ncbi:hypothetical protein B0F90DRAFT_1623024 [Multifurca ochricompacta]|uniref:Ser-Thr-rich glycosyl-phosphatidyl-inositol-anchored membrane family-domain-containing protein n=1 Tax=Multifurca ochricompacta TaxID=376703 RepID=A0AAD4QQI8_9AGAM|nr:hypothetical protein B0F90DRAFT_1623024 [Multifurca ochricompacta]